MSFEKGISDHKLTVNLSPTAAAIMHDDMICFGETKEETYLNHIFDAYHSHADASIEIKTQTYSRELDLTFYSLKMPKEEKDKVRDVLVKKYRNELELKKESYEKGTSLRIYVRKNNEDYLMEEDFPDGDGTYCQEERNYKNVRSYFKAVIEEYSALSYSERERIYFSKTYDEIIDSISHSNIVKIQLQNNESFFVKGITLETDSQCLYHYLAGYATYEKNRDDNDSYRPISFRLSNIKKAKRLNSRSAFLKKELHAKLRQDIKRYGIQFLSADLVDATIRLTDEGINKYNHILHLRPHADFIDEADPHIYHFHAAENQLEFYFFKFGKDARIIKPKRLANKFERMYSEGAKVYCEPMAENH